MGRLRAAGHSAQRRVLAKRRCLVVPEPVGEISVQWQLFAHLLEDADLICGAADFFCDTLEPDKDGFMVENPTVSPENTYILPLGGMGRLCVGCTMDSQILRELFTAAINANASPPGQSTPPYSRACARTTIGSSGTILEIARRI